MGVNEDDLCNSGPNESRGEGMIGGRTGGRSNVGLGTSGGMVEGIGFGDGICRNGSPNVLWIDEWVGDAGITNCLRGL